MIEESSLTNKRISDYLSHGKRFDHRKADEYRNIEISLNLSKKAEGGAKVKIGKTEVWVGVKMSVGEPYPDSLNKGNLAVSAELTPLSHRKYEYGPPRFSAIEIGRLVDRGIRESKFIDLKKLCIKEGEKVWNVFIDIYSINDDGNLLDASFIGTLAALKSAKIPIYDEKKDIINYEKPPKENLPITNNIPLNFSIYKIGEQIILDPTLEEESASDGRLVFAAVPSSGKTFNICSMQKSESMDLTIEKLLSMIEFVENIYEKFFKEITKKIDNEIKKK
ncbi:MAG: exosome complex protein Rrp42 [Candidatus Pacearchaeota archaeon]